ncbi:XRE family transcriptional regulator [Streptomyces antioxidans]|uniref:XRE family transcriptional regulator n=2 Tax=Streptomyces TaxID=1883 RepID=UPI000A57AF4F|nr:XRE family transcriptional regulator [Streptomyces antioxidans]
MSLLNRRTLLKSGFAVTALRGASLEDIQRVTAALTDACRYFDGTMVEYFRSQLETAKCDDGRLGAQKTLPVVLGLLGVIEQQARDVKPVIRRELLSVGADGAEFAGWLYRDAHQPGIAVFWYDRAMEWAQEADDPAMQGYMLLKKSQMAYDDRDAVRMLTLAQAGQHQRWQLPTRVQAELLQQEALGCAMLGEPLTLIEQKLDTARELLTRAAKGEPSGLGAYFNEHTLLLRNAVSYTEAGKPGIAADLFGEIISAGTLSRRDTGFFNARRAAALALSGEPDEAAEVGTASAEVALAVQSERTMRVLGEVLQALSHWRGRPAVRKFGEALRAV